ncbi:transposase InsO family protein [Bradyrhizobium japonicum]
MDEGRACKAIGYCRMTMRYKAARADYAGLRRRMRAIAEARRRFGYRRLHVQLKREGYLVNHKKLFRLRRAHRLVSSIAQENGNVPFPFPANTATRFGPRHVHIRSLGSTRRDRPNVTGGIIVLNHGANGHKSAINACYERRFDKLLLVGVSKSAVVFV